MAVDFDFDGTFDEEAADEGDLGEEYDDYDDEDEEGEPPKKRNILRLILLVLIIVVALCGVCYLGSSFLTSSIPFLGQDTASDPAPEPIQEEAVPSETKEPVSEESQAAATETAEELPATAESTEPTDEPGEEAPSAVEATEESPSANETTEESPATVEATEEVVVITVEPTTEATQEPEEATATTAPVPGPTATSMPTVIVTVTGCNNNTPPTANAGGPYAAMRGKSQAIINFDASTSSDSDGAIVDYLWDFGDNTSPESGEFVTHGYNNTGSYVVTLTVIDDCGDIDVDIVEVTITGPTPPAHDDGTPTATPIPTPSVEPPTPDPSVTATLGFCHRVQRGDTLSGLAWKYGVSWPDLARVNHVKMSYYVIAGQGLFIPTGEIIQGPNVYEVQADDTLNSIAFHCGLTTTTLAQANNLTPNDSLSPGQRLIIPPWNY